MGNGDQITFAQNHMYMTVWWVGTSAPLDQSTDLYFSIGQGPHVSKTCTCRQILALTGLTVTVAPRCTLRGLGTSYHSTPTARYVDEKRLEDEGHL
jgi:hypothetical protein